MGELRIMWIPATIDELLDERIEFAEKYLKALNETPSVDYNVLISDFTKSLIDWKELKRLLMHVTENPNDKITKSGFKKYALQFISNLSIALESENKGYQPLSFKIYSDRLNGAFNKIFNDVRDL